MIPIAIFLHVNHSLGGQVLGMRSHCHRVDMAVYLGLIEIGCVRKVVYLGLIKICCAHKVVYLGSIKIGCVYGFVLVLIKTGWALPAYSTSDLQTLEAPVEWETQY
jgi:hypothetical protein